MLLQRLFRFRYSLRALLVFITLFALWGGYHANRGWKERRASAVLRRYGATFRWADSTYAQGWLGLPKTGYWLLVGTLWGDTRIGNVQVFCPLNDELADALASLPALEQLYLAQSYGS